MAGDAIDHALSCYGLPASWADHVRGLLGAHPTPADAHAVCRRLLEGAGGLAPAPDAGGAGVDGLRRRVVRAAGGADWLAAAALARLALDAHPCVTEPPGGPAAALWYAGRRDCFTTLEGARPDERQAAADAEVDALLDALTGPIAP